MSPPRPATLAVGVSLVTLAACNSSEETSARDCTGNGKGARHELRYANTAAVAAPEQSLDLYLPDRAE